MWLVGECKGRCLWWAIAAYVMYTDGELSHGKPASQGSAKVAAAFTASWSLVWSRSLTCGDARCEMRVDITSNKHQNRNN